MQPTEFTTDKLPESARSFDYEIDLPLVLAYTAAIENGMYSFNNLLGSPANKSIGVRADYDVIKVQSLKDPEKVTMHLVTGISIFGRMLQTNKQMIAGVADGKLWFHHGDRFIADSDEIKRRNDMQGQLADAIGGPLRSLLKDISKTMEDMGDDLEGEEWKNAD